MDSWKETDIDGKRPTYLKRDMNTLNETAETYKIDFKTALWKRPILMERDLYWWKETYIMDWWKETCIDGKRPILMERDLNTYKTPNAIEYTHTWSTRRTSISFYLQIHEKRPIKETYIRKRDLHLCKEPCMYVNRPVSIKYTRTWSTRRTSISFYLQIHEKRPIKETYIRKKTPSSM